MIKPKFVFQKVKIHLSTVWQFFTSFLAINPTFFYILQNGFLLNHQWLKALLLMYNTTIFEQIYFWPLFVSFELGKRWFFFNSNEFRLFIYWSNFRSAEIGQTLILVKKALLEQTLNFNQNLPYWFSTIVSHKLLYLSTIKT